MTIEEAVRTVVDAAHENAGVRVARVTVRLGAASQLTPQRFVEEFAAMLEPDLKPYRDRYPAGSCSCRSGKPEPPSPGRGDGGSGAVGTAQSADSMSLSNSPFGLAPAIDCTGWPFLKIVSVGTDMTR